MLGENEKRIQCSMHVLHSSGAPGPWYCISFTRNVFWYDLLNAQQDYRPRLLIVSASPITLPSGFNCYIVSGASRTWKWTFAEEACVLFYSQTKPQTCLFMRVFLCAWARRRCSRSPPPFSASLFGEDFVCAGRGSMNASAEVLPSPPQLSGETGTTSFRKKKKKKKKFLEFEAPWNYFVRQELSSEALRFQGEV